MANKKTINYLSNKYLIQEFTRSKQNGNKPTEAFVSSWFLLVERYQGRPNFRGYDEGMKQEMKSEALLHITRGWTKFDASRSSNIFSYLTSITHNAFLSIIKSYKKSFRIRDSVLSYSGQLASFAHQSEHNYEQGFWRPGNNPPGDVKIYA